MTAAERQKRYRERLKEAKSRLAGECERLLLELRKGFVSSGVGLLQLHDDDAARAALSEFLRRSAGNIDIVRIIEDAGKKAALALYESEVVHRMAARQRRAAYRQELRKVSEGRGRH